MAGRSDPGAVGAEGGQQEAPKWVVLEPWLSERIWGATQLPSFLEQPKPGHPVGEAWLTAVDCKVEGGGATLGELTQRWPKAFGADEPGEFPLLIKFLFPHEWLSVQVHPNDAEAQAIGQPRGKNECWYVLSAGPGAKLALGFESEITVAEMEQAIREGTLERRLRYVPVKAGDMVYVEAGTIHAIGPGMAVLETQQYSDTTYRLYDYGRPRELHLKDGLAVTKAHTEAGLIAPVEEDGFTRLISKPYFIVDRFRMGGADWRKLGLAGKMQILIALNDDAALCGPDGGRLAVPAGRAIVLPARDHGEFVLEGRANTEVIRISTGGD